ncbi:MAG: hypothetical protein O2894_13835, partial [Planctomycetota bacterium]|nr:hypothetical protein [Planctomycetota bacterium]
EPVGRTREGRVQFEITRILKGDKTLVPGARVAPRGASAALPGHAWLLLGQKANFVGGTVLMLRPATLDFLLATPRLPPADKPAERLSVLVPWLKHPDPMVAASARKEFAEAPFAAVRAAAERVTPEDLVPTLADPASAASSRGALFLLLGLVGGADERKLLSAWMRDTAMQRAAGFDALLAAWLFLTGPEGLIPIRALRAGSSTEAVIVGGAFVRTLLFHARNTEVLPRASVLAELTALMEDAAIYGVAVEALGRLEAWDRLPVVLAAYERLREQAPWTIGPTLRYLEAHPGEDAKAAHARLEASREPARDPAPGDGG